MTFTTFEEIATAKISDLKAFAQQHGIIPADDKRLIQSWRDAVWTFAQTQVLPTAKTTASKLWTIATSDRAFSLYQSIIVWAIVALVATGIYSWRVAKTIVTWAWENRDKTAVYHWIEDGRSALVQTQFWAWVRSIVLSVGEGRALVQSWAGAIVCSLFL